ncbi:MAG: cell division protein FtsZ [Bacteroidales bacterium]|nr:cell division protein FtsZ [Bacteroidales bacterium]
MLDLAYETAAPSIIKVIGVGGGGGNAVNHMFKEGIHDVSFVLCNTDNQALRKAGIPRKIQLGKTKTQGLGAGNRPDKAKEAAEESLDEIHKMLDDGTKMVFITAGMGGGTGTGAAPIIAREAKNMDILTVGIVTVPFIFEGQKKINQALDGVEEMRKHVDALLVINNERLCSIYPDLTFFNAFAKADDTLTIAAKSIAEIITVEGYINLDFADVKSILKDGGVAIMSTGFGEGDKRVTKSIDDALNSPLLNNNDVFGAQKVLFNLYFSQESPVTMEEVREIDEFMVKFDPDVEVIWGAAIDNSLGDKVKMTLLATGFGISNLPDMPANIPPKGIKTADSGKGVQPINMNDEGATIKRIEETYGKEAVDTIKSNQTRASFYIFSNESLDDDPLIEKIEQNPTYNRDKNFIRNIQNEHKTSSETNSSASENTSIQF